jgi:hypothetical protein
MHTATRTISSKFKSLRSALKLWSKNISNLKLLIANCNTVICFLDNLEDSRGLFNPEINLRAAVRRQLRSWLHCKNLYWKKRYTVNRIRICDECTKFFHGMATISHRHNSIPQLMDEQGMLIQDHESKAGLLWTSFRNRLGISINPIMLFNLDSLIAPVGGLDDISAPFSHEEIDRVVRFMPSDKALGPDGFNGLFLNKCWPIIKNDFYSLCSEFYSGAADLESINTSFITLVPKKPQPETVNDFRLISLLNISLKVLTKILADRLQAVILRLEHRNQYGFIRSRTI